MNNSEMNKTGDVKAEEKPTITDKASTAVQAAKEKAQEAGAQAAAKAQEATEAVKNATTGTNKTN